MATQLYPAPDAELAPEIAALDPRYTLHGAQEFVFERPVFAGDVLRSEPGEIRTYEKQGKRGGVMKFVEAETVYRNQHAEVVVRSKTTAIQTAGVVEE
jgi:acyl dehydratase